MTNNNMQPVNSNNSDSNSKKSKKAPVSSFREIPKISMSDLQKKTMKILVEDDSGIESLRGAKINISMDDEKSLDEKIPPFHNDIKPIKYLPNTRSSNDSNMSVDSLFRNGPLNFNNFDTGNESLLSQIYQPGSFLEMEMGTSAAKYTKPISVLMKMPSDPDPSLQKEIDKLEKKRVGYENKLFDKAKQEFKLITALTTKELQVNLNHELLPFFVVSKNSLSGIDKIITNTLPAQTKSGFLQLDNEELNEKFPHLNVNRNDQMRLNKEVYAKILNLFSENPNSPPTYNYNENDNKVQRREADQRSRSNAGNINDLLNKHVEFNYEKCLEMSRKFKNLNLECNSKKKDYNEINDFLHTSFMETRGGDDDLINVKFASSDEPYPTIEKLAAQMSARRDLAEKFERLKILEYESHLQKAENEMIQDIMHETIYTIVAKYGPAIEGMKEHIH